MRTTLKIIVALVSPVFMQSALAGDTITYPRLVGSGENVEVEYGPGPANNIVGGGRMVAEEMNEAPDAAYLDADYAQQPPHGRVPVIRGSGENIDVVWLPAPMATTLMARAGAGVLRN